MFRYAPGRLPSRSVVIMDNASFHKRKDTREAIEQAGHTLRFLPTYSPHFNPIKHRWAERKRVRRTTQLSIEKLFQDPDIYV